MKRESFFPIEEVAKLPAPGMAFPNSFQFSRDDAWLAYLESVDGSLEQRLCLYEAQTGKKTIVAAPAEGGVKEENLSAEEILRRERLRQVSLGITSFLWADDANRLLAPIKGDLYLLDTPESSLRKVFSGEKRPALDARFSPDGQWISFVRDSEIHLLSLGDGKTQQLTFGAAESGKTHGLAEYIAQEEMGRSQGYWWSPDSRWIAFTEVDETHIPVYRIVHQGKDTMGEGSYEDLRYPFSGCSNARVKLGLVSVPDGRVSWLDIEADDHYYLARVNWMSNGSLAVQMQSRRQDELVLYRVDVSEGKKKVLLTERSDIWVNLNDMFHPLQQSDGFVWGSERTGYCHLYLYDGEGNLQRALTEGEWLVDQLVRVDEVGGYVYFLGWRDDPCQRHLFRVSFSGGQTQRLTAEAGTHVAVMDHQARFFVDMFHALETPPQVYLRPVPQGDQVFQRFKDVYLLFENTDERLARLDLQPPSMVRLKTIDGVTLHGAVYLPPEKYGEGPYPTLISVYGGPHAQRVINGWGLTANMQAQYFSGLGFLVFMLDNRGSWRRGLEFEGAIRHRLAHVEVIDQVTGIHYLVERGLADPERIGIYGWSYGGYMSFMCLAQEPKIFKAASVGAPVSSWDGYDTHYTEHYLGLPEENPQGYYESSFFPYVQNIEGKLQLIHGLIDENVHFRHTARLVNALTAARKKYELVLFPDGRHMLRKPADQLYLHESIRDFFLNALSSE